MEVYSIDISSWTASFRYPRLISGSQLTLEVPPISTIMGLITAAAGRYLEMDKITLGYYFEYGGKDFDVETIYMREISKKGGLLPVANQNVIKREFLYDCFLRLYIKDQSVADYFNEPVFPLLLGRVNDLATIKKIQTKTLQRRENSEFLKGQIIPFKNNYCPGTVQSLPKYFTKTIPRDYFGWEISSVINCQTVVQSKIPSFRDDIKGNKVDIFFHEIDLGAFSL